MGRGKRRGGKWGGGKWGGGERVKWEMKRVKVARKLRGGGRKCKV